MLCKSIAKLAMCRLKRHGLEIQAHRLETAHMRVKLYARDFRSLLVAHFRA